MGRKKPRSSKSGAQERVEKRVEIPAIYERFELLQKYKK
jgi:hypothetical protein